MSEEVVNFVTEDIDDNVSFEEIKEETIDVVPAQTDAGWNDYVLSHFTDEEKFNGSPTVDGLRRITELLIGEIIGQQTVVVQAPVGEDKRATVVHTITLRCGDTYKNFDGAADVYWGNCDKPFHKYPVSTAETRAEGRALRRALKLRKIVAAEELSEAALQDDPKPVTTNVEEMITQNQINFLEIMCKNDNRGLNINIKKLVNKMYPDVHNIRGLRHSESLAINKQLSTYQQAKDTIPGDIIGFDVDWKSTFA
jgi:hypothetical protein